MARTNNCYLESKPRYEILDGLRGVAALTVVIFHCFEVYIPVFGTQIINHGYLAVDFFFLLSGFVIGYAYDDRWDKMSTWGFFKRRLTRLHPMVVAGTVIGACLVFVQFDGFPKIAGSSGWQFALCFVMALLMIPCGPKIEFRGWGETNPFNGPNWSLTYEYIGNILYALIFRHLPTIVLGILCLCCTFFTLDLTLGWDVFNLFAKPKFDVIGGWCLNDRQIYVGFARLLYPFLCGLFISRILPKHRTAMNPSGSPIHIKGGFWWCSLILVALLSVPCLTGESCAIDGAYQAFSIIVLFPVIVLAGAGSRTTDNVSTKVCKFLGDLSYPLYITHYPFIYLVWAWFEKHREAPAWQHVVMNCGVVVISVLLAYCVMKAYDEPVRSWLQKHWLGRKNTEK